MAKASKRAAAKPPAEKHTYMIKGVDRQTWADFLKRAKDDGRSLAWLFRDFITRYANGS
jgi:hypothetical protein